MTLIRKFATGKRLGGTFKEYKTPLTKVIKFSETS